MLEETTPLSSEALAAVQRPTAQARGLPNAAYTSEAAFRLERERIFTRTWSCIGVASDVREPGDVKPVELLGLPLLMVRGRDGALRVFHNVCSHRGLKLCDGAGRVGNVIRCPYHSWAYDLDGRLRATPQVGGPGRHHADGIDRRTLGLKPVRTAVWFDLVFVDVSGAAPAFGDHVAPLVERWAAYDPARLVRGEPGSLTLEVACNWKLAVENYCESYHLPWVHPGLNSYSRLQDHYHIFGDGRFAGQGTTTYAPQQDGPPLPTFPHLPESAEKAGEYVALFPNALLGIQADHFFAVWLEPVGSDRTREHLEIYYVGEAARDAEHREVRERTLERWTEVFVEDVAMVERLQAGRASTAFDGGVFSPVMDTPSHAFHVWVADALAPPAEPAGEGGLRAVTG